MQPAARGGLWTWANFSASSRSVAPRLQSELPPWFQRSKLPWKTLDEQIEYGYSLYKLGSTNRLSSLVLGRGRLFEDKTLTSNFGTSNVKLLNAASHTPSELQGLGSVLAEAWWVPYLNDAWVLGGIHGQSTFYTGERSAKIPVSSLWDARSNRPSVFGRELVQLDLSGYSMADLKWADLVGVTFAPPSKWSSGADVDFKALHKMLDQIHAPDDLSSIVKSLHDRSGQL